MLKTHDKKCKRTDNHASWGTPYGTVCAASHPIEIHDSGAVTILTTGGWITYNSFDEWSALVEEQDARGRANSVSR